jgi:hypothetical protein
MAARFAEPQDGGLCMVQGGAAGLPPLFAETLLGSPMQSRGTLFIFFTFSSSLPRKDIVSKPSSSLHVFSTPSHFQAPSIFCTIPFFRETICDKMAIVGLKNIEGIQSRRRFA